MKAVLFSCLCVNFSETLLGFDHTFLFTLYCEVSWVWTTIAEFPLRISLLVLCFVQVGTWLLLLTGPGTQFNCKQHYDCLSAEEDGASCCTRLVEALVWVWSFREVSGLRGSPSTATCQQLYQLLSCDGSLLFFVVYHPALCQVSSFLNKVYFALNSCAKTVSV